MNLNLQAVIRRLAPDHGILQRRTWALGTIDPRPVIIAGHIVLEHMNRGVLVANDRLHDTNEAKAVS